MKCPNCDYPRLQFKDKRPKNDKTWVRKNFELKKCQKCGYKGIYKPSLLEGKTVESEPKEVQKKEGYYIHCTKKNENFIRDATCTEFKSILASGKARCHNCKFHEELP